MTNPYHFSIGQDLLSGDLLIPPHTRTHKIVAQKRYCQIRASQLVEELVSARLTLRAGRAQPAIFLRGKGSSPATTQEYPITTTDVCDKRKTKGKCQKVVDRIHRDRNDKCIT
ncbi:hypothetical protein Btru_051030 [Bulinus truncatus]|nr:hypothetical protein Btru_051030 [Bulinus truncatus]